MFQAYGRGIPIDNGDGSFTVKVEIVDDRTTKRVDIRTYTVRTKVELVQAVRADLQAFVAADRVATLSAAFTDQLIASV